MTNPPNDQSGGINANAQGDLNIGADAVGRDKIVQNIINNLYISMQEMVYQVPELTTKQHGDATFPDNVAPANWIDIIVEALNETAECEDENNTLTKEISSRLKVWTKFLNSQTDKGATESDSSHVLLDALGRDLQSYVDSFSKLIPKYHLAWNKFFVSQRRFLYEFRPTLRRPLVKDFRRSAIGMLEANDERIKIIEAAFESEKQFLKGVLQGVIQNEGPSSVLGRSLQTIVREREILIDEIERGNAYLSYFLRRLDELTTDDSDLDAASPVLVT